MLTLAPFVPVQAEPTHVDQVTLSTNAITVSGVNVGHVTVSAHITDPEGVKSGQQDQCWDTTDPFVAFYREEGEGLVSRAAFPLHLTPGGTPFDGMWSADVKVTASWNGTWEPSIFLSTQFCTTGNADALAWEPKDNDPSYQLRVTGTNRPTVRYSINPNPAPYDATTVNVSGRFALQDDTPLSGYELYVGTENVCTETQTPGYANPRQRTDADGAFRFTVRLGVWSCFAFAEDVGTLTGEINYARADFTPPQQVRVTASVDRTRIKLGESVTIAGFLQPCPQGGPILQRLTSKTWEKAKVREETFNGTCTDKRKKNFYEMPYSFSVVPAAGRNVYRVWYQGFGRGPNGSYVYLPSYSPTLTINVGAPSNSLPKPSETPSAQPTSQSGTGGKGLINSGRGPNVDALAKRSASWGVLIAAISVALVTLSLGWLFMRRRKRRQRAAL